MSGRQNQACRATLVQSNSGDLQMKKYISSFYEVINAMFGLNSRCKQRVEFSPHKREQRWIL